MKSISSMLKSILPVANENVVCDYVMEPWGEVKKDPFNALDHICEFCGGKEHYTPIYLGKESWLCANVNCSVYEATTLPRATTIPVNVGRALEWQLFAEINGLGNEHYAVKFENIQQSPAKIDYLKRFAATPKGIVVMQGIKGTGKSYAAMATCELFTRHSQSCMYITNKQLESKWLETFKPYDDGTFTKEIKRVSLLTIDDFGLVDKTPKLMEYIFDLIDTRLQWNNRGTIITTNLNDDDLASYCGEALNDRICTGQFLVFEEKESRRKKKIL